MHASNAPMPSQAQQKPIERPIALQGTTYRIKTPLSDHALYVTINDLVDERGRRPFEVFINSKSMEHFQWIVGMTRILSAMFRQGHATDDLLNIVHELRSVFDPKGGYFQRGGRWMPSLVAEIGQVIEGHIVAHSRISDDAASQTAPKIESLQKATIETIDDGDVDAATPFPEGAFLCQKCLMKAVVVSDGCTMCLSCGDSKCG